MPEKSEVSKTFRKGLEVLRCYRDGTPGFTLAEIAKRTGFDRATTRRLCFTLVEEGFMIQADRKFLLSPRILTLAGSFFQANDFGHSVQPVLNAHASQLGGEITLAVRDGEWALLVAHSVTVDSRISLGMTVGSTLPLMPTAIGRVLLAGMTEGERSVLVDHLPMRRFTEASLLDTRRLLEAVRDVERSGFAVVDGEFEEGICGVAVPIIAETRVLGSLGTNIPLGVQGLPEKRDDAIATLRMAAANLQRLNALSHW